MLNIAHYTWNIHFVFVESLTSVLLIMHVAAGVVNILKDWLIYEYISLQMLQLAGDLL